MRMKLKKKRKRKRSEWECADFACLLGKVNGAKQSTWFQRAIASSATRCCCCITTQKSKNCTARIAPFGLFISPRPGQMLLHVDVARPGRANHNKYFQGFFSHGEVTLKMAFQCSGYCGHRRVMYPPPSLSRICSWQLPHLASVTRPTAFRL
jgi:hypothetical protein